jgi:hypothetical protein
MENTFHVEKIKPLSNNPLKMISYWVGFWVPFPQTTGSGRICATQAIASYAVLSSTSCLLPPPLLADIGERSGPTSHWSPHPLLSTLYPLWLFCFLQSYMAQHSNVVFFFCGTSVWTQGVTLARQVLHHLSHSTIPFCVSVGYFRGKILQTICPGWVRTLILDLCPLSS